MFEQLGQRLGYGTRRTWTRAHPTDGVWVLDTAAVGHEELPFVALEVIVSESGKSLRGSIATLEIVSPALGVMLVQDEEIRRGQIRAGATPASADRYLERLLAAVAADISRSRQRLALWTFAQLRRRTDVTITHPAA
jgi:hypothetical protein